MLDYEPIGSLAGTMRVTSGAVDFGASDVPLSSGGTANGLGSSSFPSSSAAWLRPSTSRAWRRVRSSSPGPLLADIYLEKVQSWADPAIRALNPGLDLPGNRIELVRRSDGSGTTYNFTNFLSKVSPQWREKVGSDLQVKWPAGTGAKGNEGVSLAVRKTRNSLGYVEYAQARQTKLNIAAIQNRAGRFVAPDPQSFQAAAAGADWTKSSDFDLLLTDAPGENAYPIAATVFILMHKTTPPRRARAAVEFFKWSLEKGAKDAAELGYVPLPPALIAQVKSYWASQFKVGL